MSSSAAKAAATDKVEPAPEVVAKESSGFGFLSSSVIMAAATDADTSSVPVSSVSSSAPSSPKPAPVHASVPAPVVQDVVFSTRAAPSGVVKKKKKSAVGRGRDEAEEPGLSPSTSLASPKEVGLTSVPASTGVRDLHLDLSQVKPGDAGESGGQESLGGFNSPSHSPRTSITTAEEAEAETYAVQEVRPAKSPSPPPSPPPQEPTTPVFAPPAVPKRGPASYSSAITTSTTATTSVSTAPAPTSAKTTTSESVKSSDDSGAGASATPATIIFEQKTAALRSRADGELQTFVDTAITVGAAIEHLAGRKRDIKLSVGQAEKKLETAKAEIVAAEHEQEKLAAAEEFERAHSLGETIVELVAFVGGTQKKIAVLKEEARAVAAQLLDAVETLAPVLGSLMGNLRDTSKEQAEERKRLEMEVEMQRSAERDRLDTEAARLALKTDKVRRDEERLAEENTVVEADIASQLGDVQVRRNELEIKRFSLLGEIKELERQLQIKRDEEAANVASAAELDVQIDSVRSGFERQLVLLKDRRSRIEHTREECSNDEADIARGESQLDAEALRLAGLREDSDAWSTTLAGELALAKVVQAADLLAPGAASTPADDGSADPERSQNGTAALHEELAEASMQLGLALQEEQKHADNLLALEAEGKDIDDRLPKIETEKKAHAAARRFKEAGAAAKDMQALQTRKDALAAEVTLAIESVETSREAVRAATERREAAMRTLQEVQRSTDIARYIQLQKQKLYLEGVLSEVEHVAIDMMNVSLQVRSPAAVLVRAALDALKFEMEAILEVHSLSESDICGLDQNCVASDTEGTSTSQLVVDTEVQDEDASAAVVVAEAEAEADAEAEVETDAADADAEAAIREARISAAVEVLARVDAVTARIDEAVSAEDFEQAASLDEELAEENGRLSVQLEHLSLTVEELRAINPEEDV